MKKKRNVNALKLNDAKSLCVIERLSNILNININNFMCKKK